MCIDNLYLIFRKKKQNSSLLFFNVNIIKYRIANHQHQNINDKTKTSVLLNHVLKINRHHLFSMCIYSNQCFCLQHCCELLVVMGILQTRDTICPAESSL